MTNALVCLYNAGRPLRSLENRMDFPSGVHSINEFEPEWIKNFSCSFPPAGMISTPFPLSEMIE